MFVFLYTGQKWPKSGPNSSVLSVSIFGNYYRNRNSPISDFRNPERNIPENSDSNIPRKAVYFPENVPKSETVTETHGLTATAKGVDDGVVKDV